MRPRHHAVRHLVDLLGTFGLAAADFTDPGAVEQVRLTGLAVGSADVMAGDLFVAMPGLRAHGADYATEAVAAGAVAVLTDRDGARLLGANPPGVPVVVTADVPPRTLVGPVSAWFYGEPARDLTVVGITGTNGKTTTCYFVDAALRTRHRTTAVVGTVELRVGEEAIESPRTTVEAPVLHGLFALMRERGATACSMEVSSHALALERVGGVQFDVVGFTNLQRDHLDFHGDMEGYFRDKSRLFAPGRARRAVVCVDDEWGVRLAAETALPVDTVATRAGSAGAASAGWRVTDATIGLDGVGSTFTLTGPQGDSVGASSPLPGLVNVSNAALAIVLAHRAGIPLEQAVEGVAGAHAVPGRMERVLERGAGRPLCLVDYAHTPDALVLALEAVRPITPGRLIIVFGSDGDRDRGKRPIMGQIAARLADVLVVTDENPRSEVPGDIRAAILTGVLEERPGGRDVHEVDSRAEAIRTALRLAQEADTVIVTGKGHEPTQEIAGVFHRYNDRDVFLAAVAEHAGAEEAPADGAAADVPSVTRRPDGVTVVDETDEASVTTVRDALRDLAVRTRAGETSALAADGPDRRGRSIAVLGAVDGLGEGAVQELDALGRLAVRLDITRLVVVGTPARAIHTGALQEGSFGEETRFVADPAAAVAWLDAEVRPGDVVLVKASPSAGLDQVARWLTGAEVSGR
jgi:UDP-N-acetylmuramoyl-L-alanyl-D-glutamate--2,6-diaminopimelate ligase